MLDPLKLKLAVGHADTISRLPSFALTMSYWQRGNEPKLQDLISPKDDVVLLEHDEEPTVIEGDCRKEIRLANGSFLLIYGDLRSTIHAEGHSEVIVAGDITEEARVVGNGMGGVFGGEICWALCPSNNTARRGSRVISGALFRAAQQQ